MTQKTIELNIWSRSSSKKIFKNSVPTAKKTQLFTITNNNWLTLFKKLIAVYSENRTKQLRKVKSC
jgi:hypothetical protein